VPVVLVENGPQKGRRVPLTAPGSYCIGRDQAAEVCLPDPMVSRRHCAIEVKDGSSRLRDLGSANGTIVNGKRVQEGPLNVGDRILAGDTLLTFLGEESDDPLLGKILKGYEVLKRIGRGGMGTVYLARQVSLERHVALKLLSPEMVEDPDFLGRFLEEARSAGRLNHPNIVMVYDIDDAALDGQRIVYYSMEYMAGGSVEDLLHREGRLEPQRALEISLATARGLLYAERVGLVHRDIKPGNLMIHESGTVKIGDLGIATRSTRAGTMASQSGGVSGSPHYISPEQATGQDLDSRADIYSLGASLFQMLTGRTPFSGADVREVLLKQIREPPPDLAALRPELTPSVGRLVSGMLEKNRDQRYAGAQKLIQAIEECLAELRAPAPLPAPPAPFPWRRIQTGALALALSLALFWAGWEVVARYRAREARHRETEGRLLGGLSSVRSALEAGRLDQAASELSALRASPRLEKDFPRVALESGSLAQRLEEARAQEEAGRRERSARSALERLRSSMPDPSTVRSVEELEALLPPLESLELSHPGTEAQKEAAAERGRIREAIRALAARLQRGEDALRSLLITAGTFLDSSPPRYREALEKLRDPPPAIRNTPAEDELRRRIDETTARMGRDAARWAEEAEKEAAGGDGSEPLRKLERLRDRVEGAGLSAIEAAMKRIRERMPAGKAGSTLPGEK
jgi:serine/threonine protein kinase